MTDIIARVIGTAIGAFGMAFLLDVTGHPYGGAAMDGMAAIFAIGLIVYGVAMAAGVAGGSDD